MIMDEVKELMKAKMKLALNGIMNRSSQEADRNSSEAVLNLAKAYEILNNIKEDN